MAHLPRDDPHEDRISLVGVRRIPQMSDLCRGSDIARPYGLLTPPAHELLRTPFGRSSVGTGLMGGYFSGSCAVTSRNALLHKGATDATRSRRSDTEYFPMIRPPLPSTQPHCAPPCRTYD